MNFVPQSPIKAVDQLQTVRLVTRAKRDRNGLPCLNITRTDPGAYKKKYRVVTNDKPRYRN